MQPARQWLQAIWVAVAGGNAPPVDSAALMLGDQPEAWPGYPDGAGLRALWTALRLIFLHEVWMATSTADTQLRTSAAVVQGVVEEGRRLIRAQFARAALANGTADCLPQRLLTAELREESLEALEASWAHAGVLCRVCRNGASLPELQLRWSPAWPVPMPLL